jgi:hypothetical protein
MAQRKVETRRGGDVLVRAAALPWVLLGSVVRMIRGGVRWGVETGAFVLLLSRPLVRIYLVGALFLGLLAAVKITEATLAGGERHCIDVRCLEIQQRPPWLDEDWVKTVRNPFGNRRRVSLFEQGVVRKIYDAYRESPWIEEVCRVQKEFPDRIAVKIRIRTPVVAVWRGSSYVLVDRTGVVLPRRFHTVPDFGFNVLVASGIETPTPRPGHTWNDPKVWAAVSLARAFSSREEPVLDRVGRIDVSAVGDRPGRERTEVLLYAREGGGRVEWGSAPEAENPLELPLDRKIENLKRLFTAYPDMRDVVYALVQFRDVYVLPKHS